MYKINQKSNSIQRLEPKSFASLGFRERDHLQEWIAKEPSIFGEDLLIIQKEFSGFDETQERLDLLALDKQGALVIIENKLDDSGKDVTWQALKYASYCSSLSKSNICRIYQQYLDKSEPKSLAEEKISEFMDSQDFEEITLNKGVSQRIILIAAKFRKEVTSTVLWLMNFKLQVQCFRATPFSMGEELFLNFEQIIPTKDAEDYMIGMAEKVQDDLDAQNKLQNRHIVRKEFWNQLIQAMNSTKSTLYQNISPGVANWIGAGSGVRGVSFNFVVSKNYGRAELYIDRGNKEENEFIFDHFLEKKDLIETSFGSPLEWERLDEKRACRIKAEISGNVFDHEKWETMTEFMVEAMCNLENAVKKPLRLIGDQLRNGIL